MDDRQPASGPAETSGEIPTDDTGYGFEMTRPDGDSGATITGYDHEADPPEIAIPAVVARCASTEPCALAPLYDTVDPEALSGLLDGNRGTGVSICFEYAGYAIAVGDSALSVRPLG